MIPFSRNKRDKIILEIDNLTNGDISKDKQYIDEYLDANACNLDLSENLYRIIEWKYFIEDLREKKLSMSQIENWKDPFENFILKSKVLYKGKYGKIGNIYFGSCWSLKSECDGLWKNIRSNKKSCAVKVKTSAKKLFSSIYDINDIAHDNHYFLGKVNYLNEKEISSIFNRTYNKKDLDDGLLFIQQLFIKRKQFNYEEEVRAIVKKDSKEKHIKIPVDPNFLLDEIVLDPFISLPAFRYKKKEIENAGFTGSVTRSDLYNKPHFIFKIK
jgi:hypothetical protein